MDLITRKINHNTFDAFFGMGFEQWGRFKVKFGKERNEIFQIKGIRFPNSKINELVARYNTQK